MGTFIIARARKLVKSIALKQRLTGSHRLAVEKLKGSYLAYPHLLPISTRTVATAHCHTHYDYKQGENNKKTSTR